MSKRKVPPSNSADALRGVPPSALTSAHEAAWRARRDRATLAQLVEHLQRRNRELETHIETVLGTVEALTTPIEPLAPGRSSGKLPRATQIALASDWHPGEKVKPAEVGGCNEFNPTIFNERADEFFRNLLKVLKLNRAGWDIRQLLLWLGGDMMSGWIHEEYLAESYLSPTEEVYEVLEALIRGLKFVLAEYDVERIIVPTSNGNHGRITEKKWTAGAWRTSYEFLLYRLLARQFADEPRIRFQLGVGYENHVELYEGWKISFHHGDEIRYQGGVGGIAPALYRRINRTNSGALAVQHHCFGHHHQIGYWPGATGNGSLIGATPYGVSKGFAPEQPMQASFVVDEKHRVPSAMTPIFCKEPRRRG